MVSENIVRKFIAQIKEKHKEVTRFYGIGNPFYAPDGFIRLELKSGKRVLIKDNSSGF